MTYKSKCKLCETVLESLEEHIITCKCGEITLDGIAKKIICDKDALNYMEVDDEGNEIVKEKRNINLSDYRPDKAELLNMLDEMIRNIENLPPQAMTTSINHYDFCSSLLLISSILRAS